MMQSFRWLQVLLLALLANPLLSLWVASAAEQTAAEKGLAIAVEADRRDTGWGDLRADMLMLLRNKQGQESKREMRSRSLEVDGDGDKGLTIFDRPRDVKGTAFLSFSHATKPDDQWLYLPALKRVKRIASANKSGPFMGSEFAFEDLSSQEIGKHTYKWLRDEAVDDRQAMLLERIPQYPHSGYTRQIAWIDAEMYQPLKLEFYDRKNVLLKTLTFAGYKQYLDQYWRADRMHMVNHQTGKSTDLAWSNYEFKTGLSEADFNRNALKRAR